MKRFFALFLLIGAVLTASATSVYLTKVECRDGEESCDECVRSGCYIDGD